MGVTSTRRAAAVVCEHGGQKDDFERGTDEVNGPAFQSKPIALVVDDSIDIGLLLVMILQSAGYEAVMSTSAIDALALMEEKHFDLVVSDIAMPDMDGYSLANALRSRPEYQHVPLIAVTGFDQYDDRQRALAAGFNTHVKKPIDPASFINLIRQLKS
ncbi:MAG TPA: response regulator [Pyrinomonadaceae bacterium]|nr:response regulator [Pyrinomonadaceae bacterium]